MPKHPLNRHWKFQFTPLREGRRVGGGHEQSAVYFNSRPSARGDVYNLWAGVLVKEFQFTPLREGRPCGGFRRLRRRYFNSRPSARGDKCLWSTSSRTIKFQFTPLREGRRDAIAPLPTQRGISIHAPPRGATRALPSLYSPHAISIHAPPRGATTLWGLFKSDLSISIHAPPRGATVGDPCYSTITRFQFTPLREGRRSPRSRKMATN